jgi:hypothetical protein
VDKSKFGRISKTTGVRYSKSIWCIGKAMRKKMRSRYYLFPVLVLALMLGQIIGGNSSLHIYRNSNQDEQSNIVDNQQLEDSSGNRLDSMNGIKNPEKGFSVSNAETTGILDPVTVEQMGYYKSGNITGQTDTGENVETNLTIDEENGWKGSRAEVDIYSLDRLYAVNGSFDDGIPGTNQNPSGSVPYHPYSWDAYSDNSGDGDTQFANYEKLSNPYVAVVNQGEEGGLFNDYYDHYSDSYVVWSQTIQNQPYTKNFTFSFNYLYFSGILYRSGGDNPGGNAWIIVAVGTTIYWNTSLLTLSTRNVWNNTGDITLNLPSVGSSFTFSVGIYIDGGSDNRMRLYTDNDYDNDGLADGAGAVSSFVVHLDDVVLTGISPPSFDSVQLEFKAGTEKTAISGTNGIGNASITNSSFWNSNPLIVEVLSNTSVRFTYRARLLSHRFINSTWTTSPNKPGVQYSSLLDTSPDLSFNTYLGTTGNYEEFTINITHPTDWQNTTIYDPFLNNVTSQCTRGNGFVTIPESLLDILGWWKIELESYNYAKSIEIQKYESLTTNWVPSTQFRSGNISRAAISIGTGEDTPNLSDLVNISWILPNGTSWSFESLDSPISGKVNSSERILGPLNTSAGKWSLEVLWTNGTEVAYGSASFDMYHRTSLTPKEEEMESEVGPIITNRLTFLDADNNEFLMDDSALIVGNWTGQAVEFTPNYGKNWWEGDFNTSRSGGGVFLIIVNSSLSYYDNASCQFWVNCTYSTTISLRDESSIEIEFKETYEIVLYYKFANGTGIADASISFHYSGPENGVRNSSPISYNSGNYSLNVTGLKPGTYSIEISASKQYYETGTVELELDVNIVTTDLNLRDAGDVEIEFQETYEIVLYYKFANETGITDALISFDYTGPENGLLNSSPISHNPGNYSLNVNGLTAGTYTIEVSASKQYHESGTVVIEFTVNEVDTELILLNGTSGSTQYLENYTIVLHYKNSTGHGLADASVENVSVTPSSGLTIYPTQDNKNGNYTIVLRPTTVATFSITIKSNLTNHEIKYVAFTLTASEIPTTLVLNTTVKTIGVIENYTVRITYVDDENNGIENALIMVYDRSPKLNFSEITEIGNGNYTLTIDPSDFGTFLVKINASNQYYQSGYTSFTLIAEPVEMDLVVLNGTADSAKYQEDYRLVIRYQKHSNSVGVSGATVQIVSINPSSGLINQTSVIDETDGNYSIIFRPNTTDSFTISIKANITAHETKITTFTLTGIEAPTILILNTSSITIDYGQHCTVLVTFENENYYGIEEATISVPDPPSAIESPSIEEVGGGNYTITISALELGTYIITVKASKENYEDQFESFSLTIDEIDTNLLSLNGTADSIGYLEEFKLVLRYTNSTGHGLTDATVTDVSIVPSSGLNIINKQEIGDGNYSITMQPTVTKTFTLLIRANLTYHETQFVTFVLTTTAIPTILILDSTIESIGVTGTYTVQITYRDELQNGIDEANVTIIDPPEQLNFSEPVSLGDGNYSITIDPSDFGTYLITIAVEKDNYQSRVDSFSLTVIAVETELIIMNGTAGFSQYQKNYTLVIKYQNSTGYGLSNATVQIIEIEPTTGLINYTPQDRNDGNYSIVLKPNATVTFTILIQVNLTAHETQYGTFTLTGTAIPTFMSLNISEGASISYGEQIPVHVTYTDYINGLEKATFNFTTNEGIGTPEILEIGDGNYSVTFHPNKQGAYIITISASKENYQTRYTSFSLSVEEIETMLDVCNGTSAQVEYGEDYRLVLNYMNILEQGLVNATVEIDSVSEPGLVNGTTISGKDGYYSIILTPTVSSVLFTIVIKAELPNYQTKLATFTLSALNASTILILKESSKTIPLDEDYTLSFGYYDQHLNGLKGANVEVLDEPEELDITISEIDDGNYSLLFDPLELGTYLLTIKVSKLNYEPVSKIFSLTVEEIETILIMSNGTDDSIRFGQNYTLMLQYESKGIGLIDANVVVTSISPKSGLLVEITNNQLDGYYSLLLQPTRAEIFLLTLKINLANYKIQVATFTLNVEEIPTTLTPHIPVVSIAVDRNYTIRLFFADDNSTGLENGTISIITRYNSSELAFSDILELGDGFYNITVTPLSHVRIGYIYRITFRAHLINHQNATAGFDFQATKIPTQLIFTGGASLASIPFLELYDLEILYARTDIDENITGALITIDFQPSEGVDWTYSELKDKYHISLRPEEIDTWILTITVAKTNYKDAIGTFRLTANRIDTYIVPGSGTTDLFYGRTYSYIYRLLRTSNDSGISGAHVIPLREGSEWFHCEEINSGDYNITVTPLGLRNYSVLLRFEKEGFETTTHELLFSVDEVPIRVNDYIPSAIFTNQPLNVTIELREGETTRRIPVTDAIVTYEIKFSSTEITGDMNNKGNGYYSKIFNFRDANQVEIKIFIEKENYKLEEGQNYFQKDVIVNIPATELVIRYSIQSAMIILPVIALMALQRVYARKKRRQTLESLAVKRRFDDLKNLIGIIVLHKTSGLPIYSKMLTTGFDSSMISAFITAIRNFRSEIDEESAESDFDLVPISDIVRVVTTRSLICAFITVTRPTPTQSEKMIEFAKAVGFQFDDIYDLIPVEVIDDETIQQFEYHFDNLMDGKLLKKFRMAEHGEFPRSLKCVERKFEHLEATDGFDLDDLAAGVASCGLEEARAYKIIMDYIEKGTIVPLTSEEEKDLGLD